MALVWCVCASACGGDLDCCGLESCPTEMLGRSRCQGDGTAEICREAGECSWFCNGNVWCPPEECGPPESWPGGTSDPPRAWDCVEAEDGYGACLERGARPCDTPGEWGCDGASTTYCMSDGWWVHVEDCTMSGSSGPWNPLCVVGATGVAGCGFEGSASCDPDVFGVGGWGCLCEGNRQICCDSATELTYIQAVCPYELACVPAPSFWACQPRGADADADADDSY